MMKDNSSFLVLILFIVLALIYFVVPFGEGYDTIFISLATFLFSIFTGFFIARQGTRYSSIRKEISNFDGNLSFIYRASGHLEGVQGEIADLLKNYYSKIVESKKWDYHFNHKSTTITDIHRVIEASVKEGKPSNTENSSINRIMSSLLNLQVIRKNMIALYQERIPGFQWFLIYIFVLILLITVSSISSHEMLIPSILKAAFAAAVISVLIILHKLDNLSFFEGIIGEHSAKDALEIINETK